MTIEELDQLVVDKLAEEPWRRGQAYFNVLASVQPDLAEAIRGKWGLDPFYDDGVIPHFRECVGRWLCIKPSSDSQVEIVGSVEIGPVIEATHPLPTPSEHGS